MPDPIRPGHVSFDISFSRRSRSPTPADEDAPLRIAILGHFSGRADAAGSRPSLVDAITSRLVCAQFASRPTSPPAPCGTAEIDSHSNIPTIFTRTNYSTACLHSSRWRICARACFIPLAPKLPLPNCVGFSRPACPRLLRSRPEPRNRNPPPTWLRDSSDGP
jgi:hypothetical protein